MKMDGRGEVVFSARFKLDCDCANEACEHFIAELNNSIQEAWQAGRKAGILAVIEKLKSAAGTGLVLRLKDGELELPPELSSLSEKTH